jgi:uncharacterized protein YoxC
MIPITFIIIAILLVYAICITIFCFKLFARLQNSRKRYDEIVKLYKELIKQYELGERLTEEVLKKFYKAGESV